MNELEPHLQKQVDNGISGLTLSDIYMLTYQLSFAIGGEE